MNDIEYIGNGKFVVTEDWLRETLSATLEMKNVKPSPSQNPMT